MRLDLFLVNNGYCNSRTKACDLIKDNKIEVNGKIINKPSYDVDNPSIKILENDICKYVSRGGLKLKKAIDSFNVDVKGKVFMDIGSSTGGFTDCLLKHDAKKVIAVDVGTNQLDESLKNDKRVEVHENTNFKDVSSEMVKDVDMFVCDVSFISIIKILSHLCIIKDDFEIITLYKPQFEVGNKNINSKGIVKNKDIIITYLDEFMLYLKANDIGVLDYTYSPIKGKDGNIEFLFHLKRGVKSLNVDIKNLVKKACGVLNAKSTID